MKVISRKLTLDKIEYYKKHFSIISVLIPTHLTNKEIEILSMFLSLDKIIIEDYLFNTEARKRVMKQLKLKPSGLSNHLDSMINKKVLIRKQYSKKLYINEFLLPENDNQGYQIMIQKNDIKK